MQDADYGRALGAERLSFHWVSLPPGERSSYPHAESLEEEIIYVISGNPHVWINGYLYELKPGLCVGFVAGTGVAHTFINNSEQMVDMIVLGDPTKKENKCAFPLNPELKIKYENIWWANYPPQEIGPHGGEVGNRNYQKNYLECPYIFDVYSVKRSDGFSYKGDNEKFTLGLRLTNKLNLRSIGLWHERIMPGRRSSWPHAHLVEEEAAILIKGSVKVWLQGHVHQLIPGDAVFFKPGTGIAHVIMNEGSEEAEFLGIGEANGGGDEDKVYYPLHDARNEQCREENYLWSAPPKLSLGADLALPLDSSIYIESVSQVDLFLKQAQEVLYSHEAEYGLLLGLCELKLKKLGQPDNYKYFLIKKNNQVISAAVLSEKSLILTTTPAPYLQVLARYFQQENISIPEVVGSSFSAEAFARVWSLLDQKRYFLAMAQKIYTIENVLLPVNDSCYLDIATKEDEGKTTDFLHGFCLEALPNEKHDYEDLKKFVTGKIANQEIYVLRDRNGTLVSMNYVGRPTKNGISVSGVYTPKELRGRGYASILVAMTSQKMLDQGKKFCVLYTDISNPTSNGIYQRMGYREVASSRHYLFKTND